MRKSPFKSLTLRIWTTFIVLVVIIILAISFVYLVIVRNMNLANQLQNLESSHETLMQMFTQSTDFSPSKPPKFEANQNRPVSHIIVKATSAQNIVSVIPLDRHFNRNPDSINPLAGWFLGNLSDDKLTTDTTEAFTGKGTYDTQQYLFTVSPIVDKNANDGIPTYFISYLILERSNGYISMFIIIGLIFIAIALIVSKIISNYISRPLKQLEKQTLKIAHKEWVEPMIPTSNDEIGSLISSINFMQNALQQADQEERNFLQSISHDLKTPIMVIISHAEAIKDGIYIDSLENTAEIIKSEALRLENKVKQILYYNTLDYALTTEQDKQEIDLARFMNYIIKRFQTVHPQLDWQLSLKSILVLANSERLQVALENILDNQMRYAKSFIRIVIRQDDHFALIHISNNGPSIPEEQLPNIFKNLYRGEKGKFGLGLAITYKIINFYGGSITVENNNTGVVFKIKLPLAAYTADTPLAPAAH